MNLAPQKLHDMLCGYDLKPAGKGAYRGSYRGYAFLVEKFVDPVRPRTATRWSGPQTRWRATCAGQGRGGAMTQLELFGPCILGVRRKTDVERLRDCDRRAEALGYRIEVGTFGLALCLDDEPLGPEFEGLDLQGMEEMLDVAEEPTSGPEPHDPPVAIARWSVAPRRCRHYERHRDQVLDSTLRPCGRQIGRYPDRCLVCPYFGHEVDPADAELFRGEAA